MTELVLKDEPLFWHAFLKLLHWDVVGSGGGVCRVSATLDLFGILTRFLLWPFEAYWRFDELDTIFGGAPFLRFTLVWRHSLLRCKRVLILCSKRVDAREELMKKVSLN